MGGDGLGGGRGGMLGVVGRGAFVVIDVSRGCWTAGCPIDEGGLASLGGLMRRLVGSLLTSL